MKLTNFLIIAFLAMSMNISCSAQSNKDTENETTVKSEKVEVFYFHNTRRCATCKAVEAVARESIKELYGDDVSFKSYNIEESDASQKSELLDISGQTLLIVSGDTKINLTNEGFMNARSNPKKFKEIIKENVDPLL
jgi:hypothetical protein